jgi:hypothetical protein
VTEFVRGFPQLLEPNSRILLLLAAFIVLSNSLSMYHRVFRRTQKKIMYIVKSHVLLKQNYNSTWCSNSEHDTLVIQRADQHGKNKRIQKYKKYFDDAPHTKTT